MSLMRLFILGLVECQTMLFLDASEYGLESITFFNNDYRTIFVIRLYRPLR